MNVKTNSHSLPPPPHSRASIPVPNDRAARVLKAAGDVFLSRGYAGASLETIVAKSGGSLRDLYQVFGNKESLFMRVMGDLCEEVLAPLRGMALDEGNQQLPVEDVLVVMGMTIMQVLLSPRALALHRLVVGESPRFPTLGKLFFQMGPRNANETVAAFLADRAREGQLSIANPHAASAIFIHSVISEMHLRALTGGKVTPAEVVDRVREAVRIFLDGTRRSQQD